MGKSSVVATNIPRISTPMLGWFRWYISRMFRKSFHSVCLSRSSFVGTEELSEANTFRNILVFANHCSWWDPLIAIHLGHKIFGKFQHFSPIDAAALEKYRIFKRLGFYPVDRESRRGAVDFLRLSDEILSKEKNCLWVTPEGKFADARNHGNRFEPGISHLAVRNSKVTFLPLAIEVSFWEEKLPEIFCRFGPPVTAIAGSSKEIWNQQLEVALRANQAELARQVISRNEDFFQIMLSGKSGVSPVYDFFRRLGGWFSGSSIEVGHGTKLSSLHDLKKTNSDSPALDPRSDEGELR
ncbi:lysophospholipid acyltransferase family protein [Mariniblastus sp.]|nr:lysophospholipid acyltransferase family protein [Mariniblastus sp.]MDB4756495.1 lysophospholipid acyltransferase family protein [Mariniblastus sp.]